MVKIVPWINGSGNITLSYDGQGDGQIVINTDPNDLTIARSQVIEVTARDKSKQFTVNQLAASLTPYVDLGLPSGLLWAKCNVGANSETEYGDYYRWGAITPSGEYDTQSSGTLPLEKDAAHVNMGGDWRMPTVEEFRELVNNTTLTHVTVNGVNCGKFSKTVNGEERFILFPKAGRNGGNFRGTDFDIYSSTAYNNKFAWGMWYNGSNVVITSYWGNGKSDRLSIRGVRQGI